MFIFKKIQNIKLYFIYLVFLLFTFLLYYSSLNNFFVSDDFHWLSIVKDLSISKDIFLTNYEGTNLGGSYNPILVLLFKFFYSVFGTKYYLYHLVSLLLHSINSLLVYILAKKIFSYSSFSRTEFKAFLVALIFNIYPLNVEVLSWIAAWPHLWLALFYLLSLINYFKFRQDKKNKFLFYSLLFFVLALFTKETAISLPLVLAIWEVYFYSSKKLAFKKVRILFYYLAALALFLAVRYEATSLVVGYYGQSNLNFSILGYLAGAIPFVLELLALGLWRVLSYKFIYHYIDVATILFFVAIAVYLLIVLKKKWYWQFTVFASMFLAMAPMMLLDLNHNNFSGERYLYLVIPWFVILVLDLIYKIPNFKKYHGYLLIVFAIVSVAIIAQKNEIWQVASAMSRQIVASYQNIEAEPGQQFLTVALPDNLEGAEVFRNNLGQALELYYPDRAPVILPTLAYVELSKENKNDSLLKWRRDSLGWMAESRDGSFVVTGITSITINGVYYELWNYNYQNYRANTIRFMPDKETMQAIENGQIKILTFDKGVLKILE